MLVNHDGRKARSKSWMWVYHSGHLYQDRQIVLYEYQQTKNTSHPREFLKGYDGICVTDGYQVYHTLEKELEELTIAECWCIAAADSMKLLDILVSRNPDSGNMETGIPERKPPLIGLINTHKEIERMSSPEPLCGA